MVCCKSLWVEDIHQNDQWYLTKSQDIWNVKAEWRLHWTVNQSNIDSDNSTSPVRYETIIWTNAGLLVISP